MIGIAQSVVDNNGWYSNRFLSVLDKNCRYITRYLGQYWVIYFTVVSVVGNIGWYINRFCLSWTKLVGILTFICHGQ